MLAGFERFRHAPLLVVTSRLADDYLWAEASNVGAHDVVAKPFWKNELVWVLENAWRRAAFASARNASLASAS